MKFLKRHSSNKRMLTGKGVIYDQYENINIESVGSMQVPKGTTAQRPSLPVVGQLRYNTTTKNFEVYEDVSGGGTMWKSFRLSEPFAVTVQSLGNGNDTEINFGVLDSNDGGMKQEPSTPQAVLVMVENVLQIPTTNYTLIQNPCSINSTQVAVVQNYNASGVGAFESKDLAFVDWVDKGYHVGQQFVVTGSANNNGTYTVTAVTQTYLSANQLLVNETNVGNAQIFVDGKSSITSNSYPAGYYLAFGTPVPTGKPVTVIHNLDK